MKTVLVGLAFAAAVLAADPFVGTWKINVEKSSSTDPAADRGHAVGMKLLYEPVTPDSYRITWQRPERTAGRDYEKDSTVPAGTGTFTITWQRIDERHHLLVFKKSGKEYSRRDTSVSPDGTVLTFRQWGLGRSDGKPFDYTLVFDKEMTGAAQQLPPVYFNHGDIVLDPAAYEAIAQSKFLKEETCARRISRTPSPDRGESRTQTAAFIADALEMYTWLMSPEQEQVVCDALVQLGPLETQQGLHTEGVLTIQDVLQCSLDDARSAMRELRVRKRIEESATPVEHPDEPHFRWVRPGTHE
jgi:hypothetical protein